MDFETEVFEGVEEQEVAEPVAEESAETEVLEGGEEQEIAEPAPRSETDAAFAQMRRRTEELERQLEEQQRLVKQQEDALGLYFQGDNKIAQALAYSQNRPIEQVQAELAAQSELETLRAENERIKAEQLSSKAELQMREDLEALQKLDGNIKSIEELGQSFLDMRLKGGLSVEDAYFATMAKKEATERKPAKPAGKVENTPMQKDYLSIEEVRAHQNDKAWIDKNLDLINRSMTKWK